MWSDLWLRSCVGLWSTMAQAGVPTGVPAAVPGSPAAPAAPPALPASPEAIPMPVGSPMTMPSVPNITTEPFTAAPSMATTLMHGLVLVLYFLICAALIVCVTFQTTKSEGLSGVIGGSSSSSLFKGKKSAEEHLSQWTGRLAVAFIVFSFFIWLMFSRSAG